MQVPAVFLDDAQQSTTTAALTRLRSITDEGALQLVVVISYNQLVLNLSQLAGGAPVDLLVADEAHRCKNSAAGVTQAITLTRARCRLLLTASPLQNNLKELRSLANLAVPGVAGTAEQWQQSIISKIEAAAKPDAPLLARMQGHLAARQLREGVLGPLFLRRENDSSVYPTAFVYTILLEMSPLQRELYQLFEANPDATQAMARQGYLQSLLLHPKLLAKHAESSLGFLGPILRGRRWPVTPRALLLESATLRACVLLLEEILARTNDKVGSEGSRLILSPRL